MYWLVKFCDEWDKNYLAEGVKINGQIATFNKIWVTASVYGCHSINKGCDSHSWQIKLCDDVSFYSVGIIEDKEEILKECQNHSGYVINDGCYLYSDGRFFCGCTMSCKQYFNTSEDNPMNSKESIITMTLNMNNNTLSYKINDKDYGIATNQLKGEKYRLVLNACLCSAGESIFELL